MTELLTVREVATALKVSPRQIWKLSSAGRLPAPVRLARSVRWRAADIARFVELGCPPRAEFETFAQTRLENWILADDREGCEIELRWVHGKPFVEIVRDAQEHSIDLIVVGTHGRGLAAHLLLGSVAEKLVRKARCPVLTVHPHGHSFVHPADQS